MDLESEYNNRAAVPDHGIVMEGWRRDASAYRAASTIELGLRYGGAERRTLDFFAADTPSPGTPIALFIHGGYWQALDASWFSHMARGLNLRGFDVAIMSYDLCPSVRIGGIMEAAREAVRFLWQRHRRLVVPFGHSAGGHLTAVLLATNWAGIDPNLPECLTLRGYAISGLFDLVPLVSTSVNLKMGMDEAEAGAASPMFFSLSAGRTLRMTVGGAESQEYRRQSRLMTAIWGAHGATTSFCLQSGKNHFTVLADLADPHSEMTACVAELCAATPARSGIQGDTSEG
jgi:arylformamidase